MRGWAGAWLAPAAACAVRRRRRVSGRRTRARPLSPASGRSQRKAGPAASRRAAGSGAHSVRSVQPRMQPRTQHLASRPHSPACETRPRRSALQRRLVAERSAEATTPWRGRSTAAWRLARVVCLRAFSADDLEVFCNERCAINPYYLAAELESFVGTPLAGIGT